MAMNHYYDEVWGETVVNMDGLRKQIGKFVLADTMEDNSTRLFLQDPIVSLMPAKRQVGGTFSPSQLSLAMKVFISVRSRISVRIRMATPSLSLRQVPSLIVS